VEPQDLGRGLVLRSATDADVDGIVALSARLHGANEGHCLPHLLRPEAPDVELPPEDLVLTTGPEDWTVVVDEHDGGQVVSICALFAHRLRIGNVVLPVGQVEYVATDEAHQRRGLVRRQIDELHRRSDGRGDLLTLITGIPHYYRRFGYGYALDWPRQHVLPHQVDVVPGVDVRPSTRHDVPAVAALHEAAQARCGVALQRSHRSWATLLAHGAEWNDQVLVAEQHGEVVGSIRLMQWPEAPAAALTEGAARSEAAGQALLAAGRAAAGADAQVLVWDRHGDPFGLALHRIAPPAGRWHPTYVRVPDPIVLLDALRPVLSGRLVASAFAEEAGELVISLYTWSIRLAYANGDITEVAAAPGIEDPEDQGDVGVSPDELPALLLGRFGASGLARRVDDVLLGLHADLMDVLFPRLANDHGFPL
jgi:predicted N-acetyltransferase YhbS